MFMEMTVCDGQCKKRGWVQLELDWASKKWSVQEAEGEGWTGVGFAKPAVGTFEWKDWGVIWLWEDDAKSGKRRNTAIIRNAPSGENDAQHIQGPGRIFDPSDTTFKDGSLSWKTPGLTPVRKRVLDIIARVFPGFPGCLPIPNAIDSSTGYSGKVTNCGVLPGWVARQLGFYLPWEEKYKNWKFRQQEYVYKIAKSEIIEDMVFTGPMAAGWGDYAGPKISGYPKALERARNLPEGTIWIPYNGGKQNKGKRPKPGDIYVLQDAGGNFAHVGIIVDSVGSEWRTADCGQCGKNAAAYKRRMFDVQNGTLILNPPETNIPDAGTRWLQGWIDIDQLFAGWKG